MTMRRMAGTWLAVLALAAAAASGGQTGYLGSGHEEGQGCPAPPAV